MKNNLNKKTRAELMALLDSLHISYRKNDKKQVLIDKASANLVEVSSEPSIEKETSESTESTESTETTESTESTETTETIDNNVEDTKTEKENPDSNVQVEETLDLKEPKPKTSVFGQVTNDYSFDKKEVDLDTDQFEEKDQLFHYRTPVINQEGADSKVENTSVQENQVDPDEEQKTIKEDTDVTNTVDLINTRKGKYKELPQNTANTVEKSREKVDDAVDKTSNFVQKTYDNLVKGWQEEDTYLSNQSKLLALKDYYLNLGFAFTSGMLFLLIIKYIL